MSYIVGVDTGGTHTDAIVVAGNGRMAWGKASTTHYNLAVGFLAAISDAARHLDATVPEVLKAARVLHYSTTVGTNVLIERNGPKLGLITTRGFEDTLDIGRAHNWADGLDRQVAVERVRASRPEPLIPRTLRVGVRERIDCFGNVVMPLDDAEVRRAIRTLTDQCVRGFVVSLLWSFANPKHEERIRELIREAFPDCTLGNVPVLLSSEVCPKIDEYRRTITTVLDGYLCTQAEEHFLDVTENLRQHGHGGPLLVVRNTGGVAAISRTRPVHLYGSGPVAGVMGGATLAQPYGLSNVLVTDMGGTSFDIGLVLESQPRVYDFEPVLDRWRLAFPVIATHSIGAGGGSIASVDAFGQIRVGPQSAGALPGPAAYDRGGIEPTVTDADLVLGYLDPENFLGGRLPLDHSKAEQAIQSRVADPLGISVTEAAARIRLLVDAYMGQEIYKQTALKGFDPRDFVMFAFGGAGPGHCCGYASYADVSRVMTFPFGAAFNAFGAAAMNRIQTYERSQRFVLFDAVTGHFSTDIAGFNATVAGLVEQAIRDMAEEGLSDSQFTLQLELDITYAQQIKSTRIATPLLYLTSPQEIQDLCRQFNEQYARRYGLGATFPEGGIQINAFVVHAVGPGERIHFPELPLAGPDPELARKGMRPVFWISNQAFVETPVYERDRLRPGNRLAGPAIVEAPETVCAVEPGWLYTVDSFGAGCLERKART